MGAVISKRPERGATLPASRVPKLTARHPPHIDVASRWPAVFAAAWIGACCRQPELLCMACEAFRHGGIL